MKAALAANPSHPLLELGGPEVANTATLNTGHVGEGSASEAYGAESQRLDVVLGTALPIFDSHLEITFDDVDSLSDDTFEDYQRLRYRVSKLLVGVGHLLRQEVATLRYIGPLRDLKPHNDLGLANRGSLLDTVVQEIFYGTVRPPRRWANGSAAWGLLYERAQRDGRLVRDASHWLSHTDRLNTGYELRVRPVVELGGDEPLVADILNLTQPKAKSTGADQPRQEAGQSPGDVLRGADPSLVDALADRIRNGVRNRVELVSTQISRPVRTFDVGVGISQLLPVVVAALDLNRPTITAIEQPELHVHPRLQVELGDLFAQQVKQGGVFLIETHSEHLMLRLLRRIEETHSGELTGGEAVP